MHQHIKKAVSIALFLIVILVINSILLQALKPYNFFRNDMYNMKTKEYDDLFVGTSHGKTGIHPDEVDKVTGRKSLNMCLGGQFPIDSYYIVREACRKEKPERVIYAVDPGYWMAEQPLGPEYMAMYEEFPWSDVKVLYSKDKLAELDFRASIFPWFVYRQGYKDWDERLKARFSRKYLSYNPSFYSTQEQTYYADGSTSLNRIEKIKTEEGIGLWKEENFQKEAEEYLSKLIEYCGQEGIEFVAVTTPIPEETRSKYKENYENAYQYFDEYFERKNVSYLNFNEIAIEGMDTSIEGFADYDGHMYGDQAKIFSERLGEYLNNKEN